MAVNFAYEYKKFEEQQARLRKEYKAAGMSEEQIAMMYKFDKAQLARDLAYKRRTQSLFTESDDFESETQSALFDKFMDASILEANEEIKEIRCNVPIDSVDGSDFTSDFVCVKTNGDIMVRECVYRKKLSLPRTAKLLDLKRLQYSICCQFYRVCF